MRKSLNILCMRILLISLLIITFFSVGCSIQDYVGGYERINVTGFNTSFTTNALYVKVCLNLSDYEREEVVDYEFSKINKGSLEEDEFLFFLESYQEYPNLGVRARNGECFFAELIYPMKSLSLQYVNESVKGFFEVFYFENYIAFIQDKYPDTFVDNDLPSVYITADRMIREDRSRGELSILEPYSRIHPINIKIRGGYGRASPKKSFSVKFLEEVNLFGVSGETLYLQGQFNDPQIVRNMVSLKLYDELGYDSVNTALVNVFMNEKYIGVYELTNRIDKDLLGWEYAINDPTRVYKINFYGNDCTLVGSIQTEWSFCQEENIFLDVEQAIDYYLLMKLTGAVDNIGKNYFLSIDEEQVVRIMPWDLDYTFFQYNFSHYLTGYTANPYLYEVVSNKEDKIISRWEELRLSVWSDEQLVSLVNLSVDRDKTLDYEKYVFPEQLVVVDFEEFIIKQAHLIDEYLKEHIRRDLAKK